MFKKLTLCAILLFAPLVAMADEILEHDNNYLHIYNRLTKTNTYGWHSNHQEIDTDGKVIAHLIENPIIVDTPQYTTFTFVLIFRHTDDINDHDFSECGDVDWLADNKIIIPTNQAQLSAKETGMSSDDLFSIFDKNDFKTIMNAKKVEYRVCLTNEFELDADTKKGMKRAYANYLKNKTK